MNIYSLFYYCILYYNINIKYHIYYVVVKQPEIQDSLVQNDIYGVCSDDDESALESVYQKLLERGAAESASSSLK